MDFIQKILISIPGIIIALTVHEYAHALVADKLGDKTPRFQGRLTLNPGAHIDPFGLICFLVLGIGWAKPVQVNPNAFKDYYKDDLKVSLAGPLSNFLVALILGVIYPILLILGLKGLLTGGLFVVLNKMFMSAISLNIILGIFNLLPLPGLDGFSILRDLKIKGFYEIQEKLYRYQFVILIAVIVFAGPIISIPTNFIFNIILNISSSILKLLLMI